MPRQTKTSPERLATLEARFEAFLDTQDARHAETQLSLKELATAQQAIQNSLARYTGFWGAILIIGSAIATALSLASGLLRKKLGWE